ncbi:unnamed protein product [Sphenostylis stenocarpa]|uniref:Uncharacterized protein n=1 Tax=Sphenostylis stenocarpa TaxID=92480 RepID=A0AA86TI03_9FABA|nr:unnamed protein product [Sphenostylis stenocarpa]
MVQTRMEARLDSLEKGFESLLEMMQNINRTLQQKTNSTGESDDGGTQGERNGMRKGLWEDRWRRLEIPIFVESLPELMDYAQGIDENKVINNEGGWNDKGGNRPRSYQPARTVTWNGGNNTTGENYPVGGASSAGANFKDLTLKLPTSQGTMVLKGEIALSRTEASFQSIIRALRDEGQGFFLECKKMIQEPDKPPVFQLEFRRF